MAVALAFDCLLSHYALSRPVSWPQQFSREAPLHLELGSGHGDFLLRSAKENPQINFVGIEQEWERVKKTLRKAELAVGGLSERQGFKNLRVLQMDVTVALGRYFSPKTIAKIYCLFPCPWPKKKHIKHRLFSAEFLRLLNSRLAAEGQVCLVTDARDYFQWVLEQLAGTGFRSEEDVIDARYDTKYERKWSAQGQRQFYELRLFKKQHMEIPLKEDIPLRVYLAQDFLPEKFHFTDQHGEVTILLKDFLFDKEREKAMARLIVSEKSLTQQIWISIRRCSRGWSIAKSEGCPLIPTPGVAQAIYLTVQAVAQTTGCSFQATDEPPASGDDVQA